MGNKLWYLFCFLLGVITYFIFPKDYSAPQYVPPQPQTKLDANCRMLTTQVGKEATAVDCITP